MHLFCFLAKCLAKQKFACLGNKAFIFFEEFQLISLLAKRCTNPTYNIYIYVHIKYHIYISRRAMSGYVVVAPNRKQNKSDVRTCTANECTDMIDTSQIDHTLPVVKKFQTFPISTLFCRGQWGKVSGLYAGDLLFQACFSSTRL